MFFFLFLSFVTFAFFFNSPDVFIDLFRPEISFCPEGSSDRTAALGTDHIPLALDLNVTRRSTWTSLCLCVKTGCLSQSWSMLNVTVTWRALSWTLWLAHSGRALIRGLIESVRGQTPLCCPELRQNGRLFLLVTELSVGDLYPPAVGGWIRRNIFLSSDVKSDQDVHESIIDCLSVSLRPALVLSRVTYKLLTGRIKTRNQNSMFDDGFHSFTLIGCFQFPECPDDEDEVDDGVQLHEAQSRFSWRRFTSSLGSLKHLMCVVVVIKARAQSAR